MAIYRLSIEVLQGTRDGDDELSHKAAEEALKHLQSQVRGVEGLVLYPEDEDAPWGVQRRPNTFNIDFDNTYGEESEVDAKVMEIVSSFVTSRR